MSVQDIRAVLEQMEAWIADPNWEPDPDELALWNTNLQAAKAHAQGDEKWSDLVASAHALARPLEVRLGQLTLRRDEVRAELESLESGKRAIKGYGASIR